MPVDFLQRIRQPEPFVTVELRPPRRNQADEESMDAWFTMNATVRRLTSMDTAIYLTDNAVGSKEEENLHHLITNMPAEVSTSRICPFLTTKHTLEYCMLYAARAVEAGFPALTVLGGDKHVGVPRCVPHGHDLRQRLRSRFPNLGLGGWANPHRDPDTQVRYLAAPEFTADFYLTQVVSHYDIAKVEAFLEAREQAGITMPAIFGVFYYRSARPKTLEMLSNFLPVPADGLTRDFDRGLSANDVCARTIGALRRAGVPHVYVSNLPTASAAEHLETLAALVDAG